MAKTTRDDALLIIQLQKIFPLESSRWVQFNLSAKTYEEFENQCPKGSTERAHVSNVLSFYELAGTIDYYGLLSEDLFFDFGFHFWFNWEKLGPIIEGWQKAIKDDWVWNTTAWFANRMKLWWKKHPHPKTYQSKEKMKKHPRNPSP